MKVRRLKHVVMSTIAYNNWLRWTRDSWVHWTHDRLHAAIVTSTKAAFDLNQAKMEPSPGAYMTRNHPIPNDIYEAALAAQVETARQEFVVVKKSTGEVVDTFDDLGSANALIEKHRKQKKAALMVKDTLEA